MNHSLRINDILRTSHNSWEDETCPCGQNTQRCPGEDICLLASEAGVAHDTMWTCDAAYSPRMQVDSTLCRFRPAWCAPAPSPRSSATLWTILPQESRPTRAFSVSTRARSALVARTPWCARTRTTPRRTSAALSTPEPFSTAAPRPVAKSKCVYHISLSLQIALSVYVLS